MDQTPGRPLAKRSRVALACNSCRHTKSKCDSERPSCGRCAQHKIDCIYTPRSLRDKRLGRHEERRARLALIAAMPDNTDIGDKERTTTDSRPKAGTAVKTFLQPRPTRHDNCSPGAGDTFPAGQETEHDNSPIITHSTDNSGHSDMTGDNALANDTDTTDAGATSTIDMLATGAFDCDNENNPAPDIGYFGLSSNVALYRSLTQALSYIGALEHDSHRNNEPDELGSHTRPSPRNQSRRRSSTATSQKRATESPQTGHSRMIQPDPLLAIRWINIFFDSIGAVLPYVHESALLREISASRDEHYNVTGQARRNRPRSRAMQALLSIVYAYALTFGSCNDDDGDSTASEDGNTYYEQALHLLLSEEQHNGSRGGGGTTVETVQALLLLGSYQQNNQRAMASLTSHALCVKASYQIGLHSRSPGMNMSDADKDMRATLWAAVVNQDRILSAALGRPCLIPTPNTHIIRHGTDTAHTGIPSYFQNLSSLHGILGLSIDAVHASNLGLPPDLTPGELVSKTIEILAHLARWQETSHIPTNQEHTHLSSSDPNTLGTDRHQIILSIYYHRTVMLTCGPVLMAVLLRNTEHRPAKAAQANLTIVQEASASILRNNLASLRSFQRIMSSIMRNSSLSSFFRKNAVWWACNFCALTMCLHAFSFWLITLVSPSMANIIGMVPADAAALLVDTLTTLQAFGSSSVMSFKAHRCLQRHVHSVRNLMTGVHAEVKSTSQTHILNEGPTQTQSRQPLQHPTNIELQGDLHRNVFPIHGFPESNIPTLDDLLCQLGDNDFMSPINSSIGMDMAIDLGLDMGVDIGSGGNSMRRAGRAMVDSESFLFDSI